VCAAASNFAPLFKWNNHITNMASFLLKCFILLAFCVIILVKNIECYPKRSRQGCTVCKKTHQTHDFQDISSYVGDFERCFGLVDVQSQHICESCRRAVHSFRRTGQSYHHVSTEFRNFFQILFYLP